MASEDRGSVMKNKYDYQDYDYIVNGQKLKRKQVIDLVLDCLTGTEKTIAEIVEETGIDKKYMGNIISVMKDQKLIMNTMKRKKSLYLFKRYYECLLAEMLYPKPEDIAKSFKVKSIQKVRAEDGVNKSMGGGHKINGYGHHYLNSVYYSDGD